MRKARIGICTACAASIYFYISFAVAEDLVQKTDQTTAAFSFVKPGSSSAHMDILSSDPFVQDLLKKHKRHQRQSKKTALIKPKKNTSLLSARKKSKSSEPEIIQLVTSGQQAKVVNRSKQFVFKDITERDTGSTYSADDLSQRFNQIERLRQASSQR